VRIWLALGLLLAPAAAGAHPLDQAGLDLEGRGEVVTATLDVGAPVALELTRLPPEADLSPAGIAAAAPQLFAATLGSGALEVEGQPCAWGAPVAAADGIRIRIRAAARCPLPPGKLRWTLPFVEETAPTFRVVGQADLDGRRQSFALGPGREVVALEGPPAPRSTQVLRVVGRGLGPGGLLLLFAALASALAAPRRAGPVALVALLAGAWVGLGLSLAGLRLAPRPVELATAIGVVALAMRGFARQPPSGAPLTAATGLCAGLALAGSTPGIALGAVAFAACALGALALPLSRWPWIARSLATVLAAAALLVGLG
jgi:hypothetical protein